MVERSADQTWSRIGDYCAIKDWLGTSCVITAGSGDVGTIRHLNGATDELLVAKTKYSYAYTQPTSPILYHGNLAVEPVDATHSRIVYTLFYDQAPLADRPGGKICRPPTIAPSAPGPLSRRPHGQDVARRDGRGAVR